MTAVVFGAPFDPLNPPRVGFFVSPVWDSVLSATTVTTWDWPYAPGKPWPRTAKKSRKIRR